MDRLLARRLTVGVIAMLASATSVCAQGAAAITVAPASGPVLPYLFVREFFDVPPEANFGEVAAVAVDRRGHVYVFNRGPRPLMEFDAVGRYVREVARGVVTHAHGLRVDGEGNFWLVDDMDHHVVKLDQRGRVVLVLGRRGRAGDSILFNRPTDVAVNSRGEIYVADGYVNSRIAKFSPTGALLRSWGSKGSGPGQFDTPHAIVIDSKDRVYVADRENRRIEIFDPDGQFITQWTGFSYPQGLYVTPGDTFYVGDTRQVIKLDASGHLIGVFGTPGRGPGEMSSVHGLAVGREGEVFTAELLGWRAQRFVLPARRRAPPPQRP